MRQIFCIHDLCTNVGLPLILDMCMYSQLLMVTVFTLCPWLQSLRFPHPPSLDVDTNTVSPPIVMTTDFDTHPPCDTVG